MDGMEYDDEVVDKQWASNYILGPLYDPEPSQECATRVKPLPTPPTSASPTRGYFNQGSRWTSTGGNDGEETLFSRVLSRSNSIKRKPLPPTPPRPRQAPLTGLERKRSVHTSNPPSTRWNQGTILSRANSVSTSRPSADGMAALADRNGARRRAGSLAERYPGDRSHRPLDMLTQEHYAREAGDSPPRRSGSLRERYPGDMSHRPLAMIAREHRAADRAPHLHNHRRQQPSDTIDSLDVTGPVAGVYHHGGPFDATMKERNVGKEYAPVEAVKESTLEALKATPAEFVQDSLVKHVPLQGTAVIPPGMKDLSGRTMEYQEGSDLMREGDAPGGPYKRWQDVRYRDDDLKGKGEPLIAGEQGRRDRGKQRADAHAGTIYYEPHPGASTLLEPGSSGKGKEGTTHVRQRSISNGAQLQPDTVQAGGPSLQRSNTAGKSFTQSLKRRFGSLRRKPPSDEAGH